MPPVWLLVALLPSPGCCRTVIRQAARLLLWLTRTPLRVEGKEWLHDGQACVLASNHASYLDSVVLVAALPLAFGFVAKLELKRQFFARVFLRRIGTEYVERFDKQRGVADARSTVDTIRRGRSLVFYPEGTLTRMPGLLPFRMGVFVAAAEAGVPVVPVTVQGIRSILRAGSWFPHRGTVSVMIGAPILAAGTNWSAAVKLRDAARAAVLEQLGEPDLARETPLL